MVDIAGLADPAGLTLADIGNYFTFKVGNDNNPAAWNAAPAPSERHGAAGRRRRRQRPRDDHLGRTTPSRSSGSR